MNNPFDIPAAIARVMFQPADYLHSSRLFTGLAPEKQSVQYRRMQNAECSHYGPLSATPGKGFFPVITPDNSIAAPLAPSSGSM